MPSSRHVEGMDVGSQDNTKPVQAPEIGELNESSTSISSAAARILTTLLTKEKSLGMPPAIAEQASSVVYTPDVNTFLPTPMQMSESAAAMWACIGLFASNICQERYRIKAPEKIIVDVYSATLMLCSVFLFQVDGRAFVESKAAPRAVYLDRGRNRETYRNAASNM